MVVGLEKTIPATSHFTTIPACGGGQKRDAIGKQGLASISTFFSH